ncbi:unnamed protein product [Strongylus vulgaris]|uniref:Uncharacterized protein n=1 Tax=Strongylus vulgaris TaxID=40348 RepID=A0A3P7ICC9_STRVU|nr:unnamed protein product [Strongylus vulgaris]
MSAAATEGPPEAKKFRIDLPTQVPTTFLLNDGSLFNVKDLSPFSLDHAARAEMRSYFLAHYYETGSRMVKK